MLLLEAKYNKRFSIKNKEWKIDKIEFLKWDRYLEDEFTKETFEILKNYKYFWDHVFDVYEAEVLEEKEATKKEEIKKTEWKTELEIIQEAYLGKFWKEVPVNKKNDIEWIKNKLSDN